jgi:hypothetical protein
MLNKPGDEKGRKTARTSQQTVPGEYSVQIREKREKEDRMIQQPVA